MKKLYTLTLAAAVAVSASALNLNVSGLQLKTDVQPTKAQTEGVKVVKTMKKVSDKVSNLLPEKAPAKAVSPTDLVGTWVFYMGDYYFEDSSLTSLEIEYEASAYQDQTTGEIFIVFEEETGYEPPFLGYLDVDKGTLTFKRELIGQTTSYFIYQQPFVYNYATNDLDNQDIVGTYKAASQTITFESDNGIAWEACTDEAGTKLAGYFGIYDLEGAVKSDGGSGGGGADDGSNDEGWTLVGKAGFIDGWIMSAFTFNDPTVATTPYEVPLQRNNENENLYRLVDPYHQAGFPVLSYNQSKTVGYIQFDVTDPNHVVINNYRIDAGFSSSQLGLTGVYCYNQLGSAVAQYASYGFDAADIINILGDELTYTTFKDGVVETGAPMQGDRGLIADCNFGIPSAPDGGYGWQSNDGSFVEMKATIIFPTGWDAVESIVNDNANAPVEYFNLQGVRVANPTAGQLVIKKQGNEVTKVLVK